MSARIRIKLGDTEVEYEGADRFLAKGLPALLDRLTGVAFEAPAHATKTQPRKTHEVAHARPASGGKKTAAQIYQAGKALAKSDALKTLLHAHWLEAHGGKERWKGRDVSTAYASSKAGEPANLSREILKLVKNGFVDGSRKDGWFLTDDGSTEVQRLLAGGSAQTK
jgi:hypothetical protein